MHDVDAKYQRIDETTPPDDVYGDSFSVKVLQQEKSAVIHNLTALTTVLELKTAIAKEHKIPVTQQRLILSGKPLTPDDKTLGAFNIKDMTVIHLFPRPPPATGTTSSISSTATSAPTRSTPSYTPATAPFDISSHHPIHFDPQVGQSIREVKMWSYILVIVSSMTLFSNLSYMGATGNAGSGTLDSVVNLVETVCSVGGLYVGQLGLKSSLTVDLPTIRRYVYSLCVLAAVMILLRVVWVADVVLLAEKDLKNKDEEEEDGDDGYGGGISKDENDGDDAETPHMSDRSFIIYFSIQAIIMASIIIAMWTTCVARALRFRRAVEFYEGISNV